MRKILLYPDFRAGIIKLVLEQHDYGVDGDGKFLRSGSYSALVNDTAYAFRTIQEKEKKGQPTDRVTLKDTGEFYASHNVKIEGDEFIITANTFKGDKDLIDVWGEAILQLTEENLKVIQEIIDQIVYKIISDYLLG